MTDTEQTIYTFLKERKEKLCVLATSNRDGKPEASVVGYAVMEDLTMLHSTTPQTRKVENLKENPKASLVIGWGFHELSIQMDGIVDIIATGDDYRKADEFFFTQNPLAVKFRSANTLFLKFRPLWVRYIDLTSITPKTEEFTY